jgi:hypothetical protein
VDGIKVAQVVFHSSLLKTDCAFSFLKDGDLLVCVRYCQCLMKVCPLFS